MASTRKELIKRKFELKSEIKKLNLELKRINRSINILTKQHKLYRKMVEENQ